MGWPWLFGVVLAGRSGETLLGEFGDGECTIVANRPQ